MKNKILSFSGSFGPEGFFKDIFERIGPDAGIPKWQQAVGVLKIIQGLYEKHLKDCRDDVEATRRTLDEFFGKMEGQRLLDELGPVRSPSVEKGIDTGSPSAQPTASDVKPSALPSPETPTPEKGGPVLPLDTAVPTQNRKSKKERRQERGQGSRKTDAGKKKGGRRKGVGNTKRSTFAKAPHLHIQMPAHLFAGSFCPCCHTGKLQKTDTRELLRFVAEALLSPIILDLERLRCSSCRQIFEAELPRKFSPEETVCKATAEAAALSLLMRYGLGFPDHRLETLQRWQHVPFSDANQWAIAEKLGEGLGALERHIHKMAANATVREVDDCSVRVVELQRAIAEEVQKAAAQGVDPKAVRTGMNVTSYVAQCEGQPYRVFFIGREHQGEREHALAALRDTSLPPVVRVSDAASKGQAIKAFPEKNGAGFTPAGNLTKGKVPPNTPVAPAIQAFCLAHLVLTLEAAAPGFRAEVATLLGLLTDVFALERKTAGMTPEARLAFHGEHSAPLMGAFHAFATSELRDNKKAEPNSLYGKSLRYALNHWQGFTEFLRTPGIPLTTNEVELANKFTKVHHKNSLSFQTAHGAKVGAFYMSLIATAEGMEENPLEYLTAIIRHRAFITDETAGDWMPHTYRASVEALKERLATEGNPLGYTIRHRKIHSRDKDREHGATPPPRDVQQHNAATAHN